jgi:hypothetical protein
MELASHLAGEPWSDHPACVSPVIGALVRRLNDRWSDEHRQMLKPLIPEMLNTADPALERQRAYVCADWAIRILLPRLCDLAKLPDLAAQFRALPEIADIISAKHGRALADSSRALLRSTYRQYAYAADAAAYAAAAAADAAADAAAYYAADAADAYAYAADAADADAEIRQMSLDLIKRLCAMGKAAV